MKELKHFSHEHQLILIEVKSNSDKEVICYGCKRVITELETAYSCGECSDTFLHKACAELPMEINYLMHSQHPLILSAKSPYSWSDIATCNVCHNHKWKGFTYHCSKCEFDACILCVLEDQITLHPGHPHLLMLKHRLATFSCDACGTEDKDLSYVCIGCQFWVHKTCAFLPRIEEHKGHNHPLSLTYFLQMEHSSHEFACDVCRETVHLSFWAYQCRQCRYFVHLKCIKPRIQPLEPKITLVQPRFEETFRQPISLDGRIPSVNELQLDPFRSLLRNLHGTQPKVALPNQGLDLGNFNLLPPPNNSIALLGDESESSNSVGNDAMIQSTQANGVSLALRLGRGFGPRVVELPNESTSSYSVKNYSIIPRSFTPDNIPWHVAESDSDHMDIDAFVQNLRRGLRRF